MARCRIIVGNNEVLYDSWTVSLELDDILKIIEALQKKEKVKHENKNKK